MALDKELSSSRLERYNNSKEEVREWLFKTLKLDDQTVEQLKGEEFIDTLRSGTLLCQLGKMVTLANNPCVKVKDSKMPFVQMENIMFFLNLCDMIGLPHDEIFQTVDLYDKKDPYQIMITIISFSRYANQRDPSTFPGIIGPKVAKMKPAVPHKPSHLR